MPNLRAINRLYLPLGAAVMLAGCRVMHNEDKMESTAAVSATHVTQLLDLDTPERNPSNCPAWARVEVPRWVKPYQGVNGAPERFRSKKGYYGGPCEGIDRYQANHFVWYTPETAAFLYKEYTPVEVDYRKGTLPGYEALAAKHTAACKTETEKGLALLTRAMPEACRHPGMPPLGPATPPNRNLDDEALLASGCGWCNEQARVFIRLCQVSGLQARMIHLFGQNHTITEFHADGQWVQADASNFFAAAGKDGRLLSAAECHDGGVNQRHYAEAKVKRMRELCSWTFAALGFPDEASAQSWRDAISKLQVDELAVRPINFGVMNCPLPPPPAQ